MCYTQIAMPHVTTQHSAQLTCSRLSDVNVSLSGRSTVTLSFVARFLRLLPRVPISGDIPSSSSLPLYFFLCDFGVDVDVSM